MAYMSHTHVTAVRKPDMSLYVMLKAFYAVSLT